MNQQEQSKNSTSTKASSFVGNTQLNRKYKNNTTVRRDHRESPEILFNFIQHIKETEYFNDCKITNNPWVDICPFKCNRDNLNYCLWPSHHLIYCNPPFSGSNMKKWLSELVKFVEIKQGNALILHKIDGMCGGYWFDLVYTNKRINGKRYILRNNFCFSGYHTNKQNKGAPFGTALVLLQPNKSQSSNTNNFVSYARDLEQWKNAMSNDEYNALQNRQREHKEMHQEFFQCKQSAKNNEKKEEEKEDDIEIIENNDNNDNKKCESNKKKKDNTITQMLCKQDDGESAFDDNVSLDEMDESIKKSKHHKLQKIFGDDIFLFLNNNDESCMDIDINMEQIESVQCSQYECDTYDQLNDSGHIAEY